jgi:hypothetical protein
MNFGGSRTTQVLSELILQFFALSFCSLERGKNKKRKKHFLEDWHGCWKLQHLDFWGCYVL